MMEQYIWKAYLTLFPHENIKQALINWSLRLAKTTSLFSQTSWATIKNTTNHLDHIVRFDFQANKEDLSTKMPTGI